MEYTGTFNDPEYGPMPEYTMVCTTTTIITPPPPPPPDDPIEPHVTCYPSFSGSTINYHSFNMYKEQGNTGLLLQNPMVGRWGNFFNVEASLDSPPDNTSIRGRVSFSNEPGQVYYHPWRDDLYLDEDCLTKGNINEGGTASFRVEFESRCPNDSKAQIDDSRYVTMVTDRPYFKKQKMTDFVMDGQPQVKRIYSDCIEHVYSLEESITWTANLSGELSASILASLAIGISYTLSESETIQIPDGVGGEVSVVTRSKEWRIDKLENSWNGQETRIGEYFFKEKVLSLELLNRIYCK